jgi:hypothetical protein
MACRFDAPTDAPEMGSPKVDAPMTNMPEADELKVNVRETNVPGAD